MNFLSRLASLVLALGLLLSCGGGVDESTTELQSVQRSARIQSTAGCGEVATLGLGPGAETEATDPPEPLPPDLIVKKVWLETPWGNQVNVYGTTERPQMKAQIENIGEGPPSQMVPGVFILSRGYFKDAQGDRRIVGSDETQSSNLEPGATHTETESLDIAGLGLTPGIWNIIYCVNRNRDDDTTSGAYEEKHKSNNCSTEAVFEVITGTVNVPNVDIVSTGFALLQDPIYAAGQIRLGAWVKNQGSMDALMGIRSTYTASCNGGPAILLADDGTDMEELRAGGSVWEEIQTAVTMPDVVGTCIITFTVDTGNVQSETDETNNTATLSVTLAPRPLPDFIITYVGIGDSNDTSIRKGSEKHPTMRIKNVGSGPATSGIYNYYYWCNASLQCSFIDGDNTEAAELCVGCEAKERIDRSWSASQRGTFYLKVCTDVNEQQPELDETNNCRFSSPITVK